MTDFHSLVVALTSRPAFGTDQQERGAGGELRLLQWQAVTSFSTHNSTGSKDVLGGSLVYELLLSEPDPEAAAATFIRLNDIVIEQDAVIPLVQRSAGNSYGIHNRLNNDNVLAYSWEALYWNIANWNLATT